MKSEALALDQLTKNWWLKGRPRDEPSLVRILERALTTEPTSLVSYSRAHQLLEVNRAQLPSAMQARAQQLATALAQLVVREHQVDALGDLDNDPETLFEILGDEAEGVGGFDSQPLRRARLGWAESRANAARALLDALGWDRLPEPTGNGLHVAIEDLTEREQHEAWGLFVDQAAGIGVALGIRLVARESGEERLWSEADDEVRQQARMALGFGFEGQGWEAKIEWPTNYVGESIGLPLYVAALVASGRVPRHALTASTGRLDVGGEVRAVAGIREKIEAARRIGIRRVLVPTENLEEARAAAGDALTIVPIGQVREVAGAFRQSISSVELGYSGLIRLVRASVPHYGLAVMDEIEEEHGLRFVVATAQGRASISVYRNGTVHASGAPGPVSEAAARLVAERVPPRPEQRENLPFLLPTPELQSSYQRALQDSGAVSEEPHEHERWRMRLSRGRSRATVVLYNSGTCVVEGTAPAWDEARNRAQEVTEPIGGLPSPSGSSSTSTGETQEPADESEPHVGTDEAGKGDYFGPLVSAAVFVDQPTAIRLRELGVRDSKLLGDRRVRDLAREIRRVADDMYAVTPINPRKFNELHEQFRRERKNINSLLAWGHARSIEKLLTKPKSKHLDAKFVVVDQFADRHYIEERTRRAGIPVLQRPKAEADIAVAAASILARDAFLEWIERWSERTQVVLPKGASTQVITAAKEFVRRWGAKWLGDVAKLSFRTTKQVLEGEDVDADRPAPEWSRDGEVAGEG